MSTPVVQPPAAAPDARARLNLNPAHWGVRAIAEIGVAVALAAALSWIAQAFPLRMPQGGSFGLEMLPILFIAMRRGVLPGVVAGGLFGLLQLTGVAGTPYIYHPLQAALDYPLAFAALGLAGLVPVGELEGGARGRPTDGRGGGGHGRPAGLPLPLGAPLLRRVCAGVGGPVAVLDHLQPAVPAAVRGGDGARPLAAAAGLRRRLSRLAPADRMSPEGAEDRGRLLAVVFLDGDYGDPSWYRALAARADILLAADGGAAFLAAEGITPQAVVGDFDSLDEGVAGILEERGVELVRHPVRKDVTDGELAVEEALRRGAGEVVLAGATGALDHTLGHLAILRRLAARGIAARLVAPDLAVTVLVAPAEVVLAAPPGVRVSSGAARRRRDGHSRGFRLPAPPRDAARRRLSGAGQPRGGRGRLASSSTKGP